MNPDYDPQRLDALLQGLFDEALRDSEVIELNATLLNSQSARSHYRKGLRIHAALIRQRRVETVVATQPPAPGRCYWPAALGLAAAIALLAVFSLSKNPVAKLTGSTAAIWSGQDTPASLTGPLDLISGYAEITYQSGVRVILEGPCRFQVTSATSMQVAHGRASVKVPKPVNGFHLDTPAGRITDLGTEFGVAVGSGVEGPVILTEVFDGEIEIPAEDTPRKRLSTGDSLAIVRDRGNTRLISTLGDYRIDLADSARRLPASSSSSLEAGNLALGKPVTSPAFYAKMHGNVFPPHTLTDGRLNDSGLPGDWSFWLAPNGEAGEFTVDLLNAETIGRIDLQNTRNRTYGDRGFGEIQIMTSIDGKDFQEVLRAELQRIPDLPPPGVAFPFESFTFPAVNARYVKLVGISYYRHPDRLPGDPNHGGGLNEIRIFAK
jgi:hypothetical protein